MYKKKRSFQIFYPKITILVSMLPICYIKLHVTYYLLFFVQQYLIIFFCSENIVLSNLKFHDILLTELYVFKNKILKRHKKYDVFKQYLLKSLKMSNNGTLPALIYSKIVKFQTKILSNRKFIFKKNWAAIMIQIKC